jgi:hypothetical protein
LYKKGEFNKYEKQGRRLNQLLELYARMLLNGDINYIKLKNVYNKAIKDDYAEYNIRKIIRQRHNTEMITEKLIELTEKHGITAEESLRKRKQLLDLAIEKGDLTNANKALDSFDTKLDLQPVKQQQITTTQTDYIKLIDKGNNKQIEAKQVKQLTNTPEQQETGQTSEETEKE